MKLRRLICFIITLAVVMASAMSVSVLSVSAEKVSTAAEYKESFDYAATNFQNTLLIHRHKPHDIDLQGTNGVKAVGNDIKRPFLCEHKRINFIHNDIMRVWQSIAFLVRLAGNRNYG